MSGDGEKDGRYSAQVVLRNEEGFSILDAEGPVTAEVIGRFAVSEERIEATRQKLKELGFEPKTNDRTTISVTGDKDRVREVFGLAADAGEKGVEAHATEIPEDLRDAVADVIVTPGPEFFGDPAN